MEIRLIITDFDGTLVDTFEANYRAYRQAFESVELSLSREAYRQCFGFRFDKFMAAVGITDKDMAQKISQLKGEYYPTHFEYLRSNESLLNFIRAFKSGGGLTAVASTARRKNLENALRHISATDDFDLILAGEDVANGKPSPEIYQIIMRQLGVGPHETLVFEDSEVGIQSASASGASYIKVQSKN